LINSLIIINYDLIYEVAPAELINISVGQYTILSLLSALNALFMIDGATEIVNIIQHTKIAYDSRTQNVTMLAARRKLIQNTAIANQYFAYPEIIDTYTYCNVIGYRNIP